MSIDIHPPGGTDTDDGLDAASFAVHYARHREALYRYCRSKLGDTASIDDVVHDVFEKAFAQRRRFQAGRDFWPWLVSIAARTCIDAHRRAVHYAARNEAYAASTYREPFDSTSATVLRRLDDAHLEKRLAALPGRQRTALRQFALDGRSYDEIADELGFSRSAVKTLIHRARSALRDAGGGVAAGLGGPLLAGWRRCRQGLARVPGWAWPTTDLIGTWAANLGPSATAALVGLVLVAGGAVPADERGGGLASGLARPALLGSTTAGEPPVERPARPSGTETTWRGRRAATGTAERAGNELLEAVVAPSEGRDDPDSIRPSSFATSSHYDEEPAVYLAGEPVVSVGRGLSVPLLVSLDGGSSWRRARALGLGPVVELLLPPAYPRDPRLFAVTAKGVQVSYDRGETFETLVAVPNVTDAAFSPGFGTDDSVLLLVAGGQLWRYADDTGDLAPVVLPGTLAGHVVVSAAFTEDRSDGRSVLLGSRFREPVQGDPGLHMSRCGLFRLALAVPAPRLECDTLRLPFVTWDELPLRQSAGSGGGAVFVANEMQPFVSTDGGRSFRRSRTTWEDGRTFVVSDVAPVASPTGESAIAAPYWPQRLIRTDDGGRTWTPIVVAFPGFDFPHRVVVTPSGRILTGNRFGGIVCSEDDGRTWHRTCPTPETARRAAASD